MAVDSVDRLLHSSMLAWKIMQFSQQTFAGIIAGKAGHLLVPCFQSSKNDGIACIFRPADIPAPRLGLVGFVGW